MTNRRFGNKWKYYKILRQAKYRLKSPTYLSDEETEELFVTDVLEKPAFKRHIRETARITGFPEEMVHDVISDYFWWVVHFLNKKRESHILHINIYGFMIIHALIDPNKFFKSKYDEWINSTRKWKQKEEE